MEAILYDHIIASFEKSLDGIIIADKNELKDKSYLKGIEVLSNYCDVKINDKFTKYRRIYFSFPDRRDIILVKFILKSNIFARYFNKYCLLCGKPNEKDQLYTYCDDIRLKEIKDK